MPTYIANVIGEGQALIDEPITVESYKAVASPRRSVGDDGVEVLYGDADAVTCIVDAADKNDAERRIIATWGDAVTIDDLDLSTAQSDAEPQPREILVHLNVTVPDTDQRSPDEIADEVLRGIGGGPLTDEGAAVPVGGPLYGFQIVAPLAEEV